MDNVFAVFMQFVLIVVFIIIIYFRRLNLKKKAINEIINGLTGEIPRFKLSWSGNQRELDKLFTEALAKKPTLMFIYNGYGVHYKKGFLGGMSRIEIIPEYNLKYHGLDSNNVIRDEGIFDVIKELEKHKGQEDLSGNISNFELLIVSRNHSRIWNELNRHDAQVYQILEGLEKYENQYFTRSGCIYTALVLSFNYKPNAIQIRIMRKSQEREAQNYRNFYLVTER